VAIDPQRDRRRAVTKAPADGQHVEPRCNQVAGVGMAKAVERDPRQLGSLDCLAPFLGERIRTSRLAFLGRKYQRIGRRLTHAEL
jgi:hypothetical protein